MFDTLIDQSRDARPESGDTMGVMTSTTGSAIGVGIYNWSWAYD
jgi:hypothetical protein